MMEASRGDELRLCGHRLVRPVYLKGGLVLSLITLRGKALIDAAKRLHPGAVLGIPPKTM
ncbi:MAG: hypothetical protein ING10_08155 [Roseomonas sp.]|nr:hypothetical protein [Roseomonas sp.]